MTKRRTAFWIWVAYLATYGVGLSLLADVIRKRPDNAVSIALVFAFPLLLLALGTTVARRSERDALDSDEHPTLSHSQATIRRLGPREVSTTSVIALTIASPLVLWILPSTVAVPGLRVAYVTWCLACAGFSALLLPRILRSSTVERL